MSTSRHQQPEMTQTDDSEKDQHNASRWFALPPRLRAKATRELVGVDATQFDRLSTALDEALAQTSERLNQFRSAPVRPGQEALERDLNVHNLSSRIRLLSRYGADLCLGRMVPTNGETVTYVGRVGIHDHSGTPVVIDWRSPAAEPFFAATPAQSMELSSRRRYRWRGGKVVNYWDEAFTSPAEGPAIHLDEDSALRAAVSRARTSRMQDVLATIAADQDAIIRASARLPLLVDGGPGTGKTVVALHRAAYLLYSDPRLQRRDGNILFVGPHPQYLSYIADVLPDLGEEGVRTCTLFDLVPEGAGAIIETDPMVAALKADSRMMTAIEPAVALYEEPPTEPMDLETRWGVCRLPGRAWATAFAAVEPGTPHNEAHAQIWEVLADIVTPALSSEEHEPTPDAVAEELRRIPDLTRALHRAWPLLDPAELIADLWEVPAYLRRCAPWLTREELGQLRRRPTEPWTDADLPLLDAARHRLGDPDHPRRERVREAALAESNRQMDAVIDHLVASDDSEMQVMSMLTKADLREVLADQEPLRPTSAGALAGPFDHVVIDEAQELTDAQWSMILRRCPSRSLTIVGDRAQSRRGFPESWTERLARVGLDRVTQAKLTINYRTPSEVMDYAEPLIRAVLPDANVPQSIRSAGVPVRHHKVAELDAIVTQWLRSNTEGTVAVISAVRLAVPERVQCLTPNEAKGLEFDLVVVVAPENFGTGITAAVDRYVAATRATRQLVVLT